MSKLISTFKIGFDDETKADIAALKGSLDAVSNRLKAGNILPTGGLLAAMVGEAANDEPEPELKQMGQWVFEGQDEKWASAHVDQDGQGFLCTVPKSLTVRAAGYWTMKYVGWRVRILDGKFDALEWENSAIDRETVNDVDYLSETTSEINVMEASDIIIDDMGRDYSHNSNCLHAVVPQITQADMQHIFIKNLSEVLIQRMHSMDRFSADDCAIAGAELMPWDIVTGRNSFNGGQPNFAVVIAVSHIEHSDRSSFGIADLTSHFSLNQYVHTGQYVKITPSHNDTYRTITESELVWFRTALEACYA